MGTQANLWWEPFDGSECASSCRSVVVYRTLGDAHPWSVHVRGRFVEAGRTLVDAKRSAERIWAWTAFESQLEALNRAA